jgi:hypothetical protein
MWWPHNVTQRGILLQIPIIIVSLPSSAMHRIIEDETANAPIERRQTDTKSLYYQVSRTMHSRSFRIDTVRGWWRSILALHKMLATHQTNC